MLFGKGSLRDREKVPDKKTYGMTLAVKTLSCHMIAFAAVVHLLNGDGELDLVGEPSGYPYQKHYEEHMKYLIRAWHTPRVKAIREYLEDEVFRNVWKKSDKVGDTTPPSYPLQPTAEDLLELEDPNSSDSDAGLPTTDTGATAALTREATDLTHSASLTSVLPAPGAPPNVRISVVRATPAAPALSTTVPGGRPTPSASAPLHPTTSRRPTPIASAPPSSAASRRPMPIASDPPRSVDGPLVPQELATTSDVNLPITPALASITIEDPQQPAARVRKVQPRPRRVVDPDPAEEVQPQTVEEAAQPAPPPLAVPKKVRGGRKAKAGTTLQDTGGAAVEAGASSPVVSVEQNPQAPRRASTRTKKAVGK
ncbi:hypothetical protein C8Q73DRAFT_668023 [Cubamyces lactineus]|nr:hypothetical protein C8Q73DRAFT_668023 [Cubamyces lactineus]